MVFLDSSRQLPVSAQKLGHASLHIIPISLLMSNHFVLDSLVLAKVIHVIK
jgi:hypothetical protein